MNAVEKWVRQLGGYAQKQELVALGATDYALTRAVKNGSVVRARQGWYSVAVPTDPAFRAVRTGGRLTGLSAVRASGGWVLGRSGPLHVSVPRNGARLRSPLNRQIALTRGNKHGVRLHWDEQAVIGRGTKTVVELRDALSRVVRDENLETAVAAIDWALHSNRLDAHTFEKMLSSIPPRLRWIGDWVDARCESLPESLARTRLRLAGHRVRLQVKLGDGARIDLVVDDIVGLETDGEEFHRDRFLDDRRKDIQIVFANYHPFRAPAVMVFREWPVVLAGIEQAILDRRRATGVQNRQA